MPKSNCLDCQVYLCTFQVHITQASMVIKFPCNFFIELKSMNSKILLAMTKKKVQAVNSVASFDETLNFETEMLFNTKTKEFMKKQILLFLNLISNRRAEQPKLVGRIIIDLAQIINSTFYQSLRPYKLQYCSVNAHVEFTGKLLGKKISNTPPENFDKDSFSDYQSFVAGLQNTSREVRRQYLEEQEKTLQLPKLSRNEQLLKESNKVEASLLNSNATQKYNENMLDMGNRKGSRVNNLSMENENREKFYENEPILQENASSYPRKNRLVQPQLENQRHTRSNNRSFDSHNRLDTGSFNPKYRAGLEAHNQYEEILRTSHTEQKRIWDEQKRVLHEQISREKMDNIRYKERNQILQKKIYENEIKLANSDNKIDSIKRQMNILEREKDLEIKELKSKADKLQKLVKQRNDELNHIDYDFKQKLKNVDNIHQQTMKKLQNQLLARKDELQRINYEHKHEVQLVSDKYKRVQEQNRHLQLSNTQISQQLDVKIQELKALFEQKQKFLQKVNKKIILTTNICEQISYTPQQKEPEKQNVQDLKVLKAQFQAERKLIEQQKLVNERELQILRASNQNTLKQTQRLLSVNKVMEDSAKQLQEKLNTKEQQLENFSSQVSVLRQKIMENEKNNKEYINSLEQELLRVNEHREKVEADNKEKAKSIENMKQSINQMKAYEKGLEEELISVHDSQKKSQSSHIKVLEEQQTKQKETEQGYKDKIRELDDYINEKCIELENVHKEKRNLMLEISKYQKEMESLVEGKTILEEKLRMINEENGQIGNEKCLELEQKILEKQKELDEQRLKNIQLRENKIILESQIQNDLDEHTKILQEKQKESVAKIQQLENNLKIAQEHKPETMKISQQVINESSLPLPSIDPSIITQNQKLKEQLQNIKTEFQNLRLELQDHKEYRVGLQQRILADSEKLASLQKQIANLHQANSELTQQIQFKNEIIAIPQTQQAPIVNESELAQMKGQLHLMKEENSNYQSIIEEKNSEISQMKAAIEQLKASVQDHQSKNSMRQAMQEPIKRQNETIITNLQQDLETKKNYISELENAMLTKDENIAHLQERINQLQALIQQLPSIPKENPPPEPPKQQQSHFKYTETDLEALKDQIKSLEEQLSSKQSEISHLEQNNEKLKHQILVLADQVHKLQDQHSFSNSETADLVKSLQGQLKNKSEDIFKRVEEVNILRAQVQKILGIKDELLNKVMGLQSEKQDLITNFNSQLQNGAIIVQKLNQQLANIQERHKNQLIQLTQKYNAQNQRYKEKETALIAISDMLKKGEQEIGDLQLNILEKQKRVKELESEKGELIANNDKKMEQMKNQYEREKESLRDQVQALQKRMQDKNKEQNKVSSDYEDELLKIEERHEIELQNLQKQDKAKISQIESKHHKELEDLQNKLKISLEQKEKQFNQALHQKDITHQNECQALNEEIEFLKQSLKDEQNSVNIKLEALSNQNQNLQEELKKLQESLNYGTQNNEQIIQNLKNQIDDLNRNYIQIEQSNKEYESRIGVMKQKERSMEETMAVIEEQSNKIFEEIYKKEAVIEQLEETLHKNADEYAQKQTKMLEDHSLQMSLLQKQIQNQKKLLSEAEFQIKQKDLSNDDKLINIQQKYENQLNQLKKELEETNDQLTISKRLIMKMKETDKEEKEKNGNLDYEVKILRNNIEELEEQIFGYQCSMNEKDIKIGEFQTEIDRMTELLDKCKCMQNPMNVQQLLEQSSPQKIADLHNQFNKLNNKNEQLKKNIIEREDTIKKMQQSIKSQRNDFVLKKKAANGEISNLQKQLVLLKNQLESTKIELELFKDLIKTKQTNKMTKQESLRSDKSLINQIARLDQSNHDKTYLELKKQLNKCSGQLLVIMKKNEDLEREVEEINNILQQKENIINNLTKKISQPFSISQQPQLQNQYAFLKDSYDILAEQNLTLQKKLKEVLDEKEKLAIDIEERQFEHINTELDLQFRLMEKQNQSKQNSQLKSLNRSEPVGSDLKPAAKNLQSIIQSRLDKGLNQDQKSYLIARVSQLEAQIHDSLYNVKEKSLVLEKTRLLSMELSKFKTGIMKSKIPYQEKSQFLQGLKPFDGIIRQIIQSAQLYCDSLLQEKELNI